MSQHRERLRRIVGRQAKNHFGGAYVPSIKAVREEAPARSRAAMVRAIDGTRHYHVLSTHEHACLLLALLHPRCIEIHEQRMLHLGECLHPFAGHPTVGPDFDHVVGRGTLRIADDMGCLDRHPRFSVTEKGQRTYAPTPLVGDLLILMAGDGAGDPAFCVNWTIKATAADFHTKFAESEYNKYRGGDKAEFRHAVESLYYLDFSIPTYRISGASLTRLLCANLQTLYAWRLLDCNLSAEHYERCVSVVTDAFYRGESPHHAYRSRLASRGVSLVGFRRTLGELIWDRTLPVELSKARVLMNEPLQLVQHCPLAQFADWFCPL